MSTRLNPVWSLTLAMAVLAGCPAPGTTPASGTTPAPGGSVNPGAAPVKGSNASPRVPVSNGSTVGNPLALGTADDVAAGTVDPGSPDDSGDLGAAAGAAPRTMTVYSLGTVAGGGATWPDDNTPGFSQFQDGDFKTLQLNAPEGIAFDSQDNLYVADKNNHAIRVLTPDGQGTTLAGSGQAGYVDDSGSVAQFNTPRGVAVDANQTVYVADAGNFRIRSIDAYGNVSTLAGNDNPDGQSTDGAGTDARFAALDGMCISADGSTLYVVDGTSIRQVMTYDGTTTTLATGLARPSGLALDASGNLWVADGTKLEKVTPDGTVSLAAGGDVAGLVNGKGTAAKFAGLAGVTFDTRRGVVWLTDASGHGNYVRYYIPASGVVGALVGGSVEGYKDGDGLGCQMALPHALTLDPNGNLYIADTLNNRIRQLGSRQVPVPTPVPKPTVIPKPPAPRPSPRPSGGSTTTVKTYRATFLAGSACYNAPCTASGAGKAAGFGRIQDMKTDAAGNLYVSTDEDVIQKVTPGGVVSTLAGANLYNQPCDASQPCFQDGTGAAAYFRNLGGICFGPDGNLYAADGLNQRVRKITPQGEVTTVAGNGTFADVDGQGLAASLKGPVSVAFGAGSTLYVVDSSQALRKVTPDGVVSTVAPGHGFYTTGLVAAPDGNLYQTDGTRIIRATPEGQKTVFAGGGSGGQVDNGTVVTISPGVVDGVGAAASFGGIHAFTVDPSGNFYVYDTTTQAVVNTSVTGTIYYLRRISPAGQVVTLKCVDGNGKDPGLDIHAIAVDPAGNVYGAIQDYQGGTADAIVKFQPAGP